MTKNSTIKLSIYCLAILTFNLCSAAFAQNSLTSAEDSSAVLLIKDYSGIDEVDAQSGAMLIAEEFRKLNIIVSDPVFKTSASENLYSVTFRRLGEKILVRLSQEKPVGTVIVEKQLWIATIDEMIAATPRLVDALVNNKSIESTIDVETVTETEGRELRKVQGESHWNLGFFGAFVPGTEVSGTPGYRLGWSYELPTYAVESEGRFFFGENTHYAAFSVGVIYLFNKQNISPYIGGGFTVSNASHDSNANYSRGFNRGMGLYAAGGVQMLRTTQNRLKFEIRLDRPLYTLETKDVMPISIGIFFSRSGSGFCLF